MVTVAMAVGAGLLYIVRSEIKGDVTRLDGRIDTHREAISTMKEDLRYIRSRIDQALNGHAQSD